MLREIVRMMAEKVVSGPKPAVYISGGLDSTIVLHHLREKYDGKIRTYTARFGVDTDQCRAAEMVAEHYGTTHKEIEIKSYTNKFPEILSEFDRPRFNIWPYFLAKIAKEDDVKTIYNGEGGDQHFGGMVEPDYLKMWANFLIYTLPSWKRIHTIFGLDLRMPFADLDWRWSMQFFKPTKKMFLRNAYNGIIPEFVMDQVKLPPASSNYWQMWRREITHLFPNYVPNSMDDIRRALHFLATDAWMKTHKHDFEVESG